MFPLSRRDNLLSLSFTVERRLVNIIIYNCDGLVGKKMMAS